MNHDIFISYSSKQKSIADGVCHYLEENGFKCWMAPRDIPAGSEYGNLIEDAIKACKVVVLVFSKAASISKWVKGEINVAFTEDKPILPFRIDATEITGGFRVMLNQMHWIDAFPQYADRLPDLLNSVCGFLGRQPHKVSDNNERLEAERKAKEAECKAKQERLERERAEVQRRAQQEVPNLTSPSANAKPKPKKGLWIALGAVVVVALVLILVLSKKDNDSKSYPFEAPSPQVNMSDLTITVNSVSFVMKPVEGGTFWMGAQSADPNGQNYDSEADNCEQPVHNVTVSTFYIGETEVTQALWKAVMGTNPSYWQADYLPVHEISWNDVQEFVRKLNSLTGRNFRLPTEAEWEYAAKGGNKSNGYKYAGSNSIGSVAWYFDNSGRHTNAVKCKLPNELGLFDMIGNVREWCSDMYDDYSSGTQTNPNPQSTSKSNSLRVLRGSSHDDNARGCRVSTRYRYYPDQGGLNNGFRLALSQ